MSRIKQADIRKACRRTSFVNNLPPFAMIPTNSRTKTASPEPSPSGFWWFMERLSREERELINNARTGDEFLYIAASLYWRYPQLAAEACNH